MSFIPILFGAVFHIALDFVNVHKFSFDIIFCDLRHILIWSQELTYRIPIVSDLSFYFVIIRFSNILSLRFVLQEIFIQQWNRMWTTSLVTKIHDFELLNFYNSECLDCGTENIWILFKISELCWGVRFIFNCQPMYWVLVYIYYLIYTKW